MERTIGGSPVALCTLSMLSNPILDDRRLYELVPMERLIVDESSQIDVGEFMVSEPWPLLLYRTSFHVTASLPEVQETAEGLFLWRSQTTYAYFFMAQ
jgi:hypothetical protein